MQLCDVSRDEVAHTYAIQGSNDFLIRPYVMPWFLPNRECDAITSSAAHSSFSPGKLFDPVPDYRVCDVSRLLETDTPTSVLGRIRALIKNVNRVWYQFDLSDHAEPLQLIRYNAGGKIDWHTDIGPRDVSSRKLSVTVQLSSPDSYEGGNLEFSPRLASEYVRLQGSAIIFPSYLTHRVAPVESSCRFSLVTWFHGKPFH